MEWRGGIRMCGCSTSLKIRMYVCECGGGMEPFHFTPTPSISFSVSIVVPSTGNFNKFCYSLIFIISKDLLGIGELPNTPNPFMDVCANVFFFLSNLEGVWGRRTYLSSVTAIVVNVAAPISVSTIRYPNSRDIY